MYSLPMGKFVDIDSCDGGWCEIEVNGDEGYVSAGYLALIEDEYDDDYDDDDDYDHHHHSSPDVEICLAAAASVAAASATARSASTSNIAF